MLGLRYDNFIPDNLTSGFYYTENLTVNTALILTESLAIPYKGREKVCSRVKDERDVTIS